MIRRILNGVRDVSYRPRGRLLDVGCGDGNFLTLMKDLGWDVLGTELDEKAIGLAREKSLPVVYGDLKDQNFPDNSFDVITLNHVVEHLYDPIEMLKECFRILRPGGELRAIMPNTKSLAHKKFGRAWRGLEPPRHIYQFNAQNLRILAERAGFQTNVQSTAGGATFFYERSTFLTRKHRSKRVPNLLLKTRAFLFNTFESVQVLFGREVGEELFLRAVKAVPFQVRKVGIALAVYNPSTTHFYQQLASIQNQDFKDWVCVLTFDSPIEDVLSEARFSRFREDPRFKWIQNSERLGYKMNFEKAAHLALEEGVDAVAFSDQDDVWYEDKLSTLVNELEKRGPGSLVHSDMDYLADDTQGKMACANNYSVWKIEQRGVEFANPADLISRNVITGASTLLDANLVRKFPKIPEALEFHDHWYAIVASFHGGVHPIARSLYAYRQHGRNVVGVVPFRGVFRIPENTNLKEACNKLIKGWRDAQDLAQAAAKEGLSFSLAHQVLFRSRVDFGLGLFLKGILALFYDKPLARYCLIQGTGKFLSNFFKYQPIQETEVRQPKTSKKLESWGARSLP